MVFIPIPLSWNGFRLGELFAVDYYWSDFMHNATLIYAWISFLSFYYLIWMHHTYPLISRKREHVNYTGDPIGFGNPTPVFRFMTFTNCVFMLLCLIIWYLGGHDMDRLQPILEFLTSNAVTIIASITGVLVAFCALVSNVYAYAVSKKYGIPFRLIITKARDVYDAVVDLFIASVAIIAPVFMIMNVQSENTDNLPSVLAISAFASSIVGIFYILSFIVSSVIITKKKSIVVIGCKIAFALFAILVIFSSLLGDIFFASGGLLRFFSFPAYGIYILWIASICFVRFMGRTSGQHENLFTAQVHNFTYLVVARHSKNKWLCLLCGEIKERTEQQPVGVVPFHRGKVSIWSIKDMSNITMRESEHYNIVLCKNDLLENSTSKDTVLPHTQERLLKYDKRFFGKQKEMSKTSPSSYYT